MSFKKFGLSVAFLVTILLGLFLRLATLDKLTVFTPDEEYILYITQTLVKDFHIIWIGVSALGFDFYMGPGLEYFLLPFIALSKGDPIIWGVITSIAGILTASLLYWFGSKLFNKKVGLIATIIYSVSALLIYYDQQAYPTGVPLLSLLMLISIYQTKKSGKWWVVFGFLYGLVFHIHLSLVLILLVAVYWAATHKKTWNIKIIILSTLSFILVISPLIGFDYFHKFSNITAPIRVFQALKTNKKPSSIGVRISALGKSMSRIFYLNPGKSNTDEVLYPCNSVPNNNSTKMNPIITISIMSLVSLFVIRKTKNENKKLLLIFSTAFIVPFIFLSSVGSVEYYLLGFFPVLILIIASSIAGSGKPIRYLSYILLSLFIFYNMFVVFNASGDYGLKVKREIVNEVIERIGNKSYELQETGGPCQGSAGWGYLFSVYGRSPDKNTADKQFSWLVPIGDKAETSYKIVINETRWPINIEGYKDKLIKGGFTVYIFENSTSKPKK